MQTFVRIFHFALRSMARSCFGPPFSTKRHSKKNSFSLTRAVEGNIYKEDKKELLQTLQFTETHLSKIPMAAQLWVAY